MKLQEIRFSTNGFFDIDMSLLFMVISEIHVLNGLPLMVTHFFQIASAVTTYLIILLQFKIIDDETDGSDGQSTPNSPT